MNKIMYEANWHYNDDVFSHCTVSTITVTRYGISPGCSAPSISAIDRDGNEFLGSIENYYETEALAWDDIKSSLRGSIEDAASTLVKVKKERAHLLSYLASLPMELL